MKPLILNFSNQAARRQQRRDWTVLVLSLLLLVFIGREALDLHEKAQKQQQAQQTKQAQVLRISEPVDPERQKLAQSMAKSLNLPWYDLLDALESVTAEHPEVFLKSVLPDARKQQIIISGEVKRLELLLTYIDALNGHALFRDALPLNQQQIVPVSAGMAFTLKLEWHHE